jgi:L-cysteate sulfo-lyase
VGEGAGTTSLGTWPTPLEPAPRLSSHLGLRPGDLWVKRDDLTGLGGGGNKVRKLEHLCAEALRAGATMLVTSGAAQSNHARITAAAAARLGLGCALVLAGSPPERSSGNVALDALFGAHIVWVPDAGDLELVERSESEARRLTDEGHRVSVIPYGGSSVTGALGYVDCGRELLDQMPGLHHVVVAVGSGGTMAGLVASLGPERVLGVDAGALSDPVRRVHELADGLADAGVGSRRRAPLRLRSDQVGVGYGILTAGAADALLAAARCEGLVLDPVYTAKALSGLAASVAEGDVASGERVIFVHTGGMPGLFGHDALGRIDLFG